jgi:hypothetical protein
MEISGSLRLRPLLVQMRPTDKREESVQAGRTVYIGGVVTSDAAGRISFVQLYTRPLAAGIALNASIQPHGLPRGRRMKTFTEDDMTFKLYMRQTLN